MWAGLGSMLINMTTPVIGVVRLLVANRNEKGDRSQWHEIIWIVTSHSGSGAKNYLITAAQRWFSGYYCIDIMITKHEWLVLCPQND